jgi:hypothetical protein
MQADDHHDPQASVWAIVGNIIGEHATGVGGNELRAATRLFRPNAKVYLCGVHDYHGVLHPSKDARLIVLGQHRKSRQWIVSYVRSDYIDCWRIRVVHKPPVVSRLKQELRCAFECKFDWNEDRDTPRAIEALLAAWGLPKYSGA